MRRGNACRRAILPAATWNAIALCALAALTACSSEGQATSSQDSDAADDGKKPRSSSRDAAADNDERDDELDAGDRPRVRTREEERDASSDDEDEPEPTKKPTKAPDEEPAQPDAGSTPDDSRDDEEPAADPEAEPSATECTRTWLRENAEAYLRSMTSGDTMTLRLHPAFRYTENGSEEQVGAGAWVRRAEPVFARYVLDETSCSTYVQAVMDGLTGRFSFGVRLHYSDAELLEAEAQVVSELINVTGTDLDAVIPMGDDRFIAEVPADQRMSRDELLELARRYFDSVTGAVSVPPSAPDCRRLQNGFPLGNGTCTERPGSARFEQRRFDLADEPAGIVAATVLYNDHVGVYLLKAADGALQDIQVVGGMMSPATGW